MAIWTVWEHDGYEPQQRAERTLFVRDAFAWTAFLAPPLWMLANRMWLPFLVLSAVGAGLVWVVAAALGAGLAALVALALMVWFGAEARGLKRWSLARRGWRLVAIVEARRLLQAERRYFTARAGEGAPPPGRPAPLGASFAVPLVGTSDVLGVFPESAR